MKNRTIIGIVCMLLAIALCFGAAPFLNRASEQKVDVICAAVDIPQGRMITEDDIQTVTVGAHGLTSKAITDKEAVIGRYAATDIKADAIILHTKINDDANGANDIFKSLDGTKKAISITLDNFAGGLSGKLKNGDIVSVIITSDNQTMIPAELKYVRVITTTSSSGADAGEMDGGEELPSTVTLLVNERQATILAKNEVNGKIHLALVYRGDTATAARFLDAQEQAFLQAAREPEKTEAPAVWHEPEEEEDDNE